MLTHPVSVYINWSAYDELSDAVPLTEAIAMTQLRHLLRLRELGVRFDYYMMDCFWYARDTGYRSFRTPHWPDGPGVWLDKCAANNVLPGLWISTNCLWAGLDVIPAWKDSKDATREVLAFAQGGYLPHLMESLDIWYQRGVRAYKFDFADFAAATPDMLATMLPHEIRTANIVAFRAALCRFRQTHPDCLLMGYNGFEDHPIQGATDEPLRKSIDTRWLDAFDSLYCGDPRPADVPCMNFWRSKDIYSDHMVRVYQNSDLPLSRIDNAGFMIGTTGTCYYRGKSAWKAMLLLSLARGGWVNTYYGNLDLLGDEDAAWFAKAQQLFWPHISKNQIATVGDLPGTAGVYGLGSEGEAPGHFTLVVNPSQKMAETAVNRGRVLYHDGAQVKYNSQGIVLGPEQMVLVGEGIYEEPEWDLGNDTEVVIPGAIAKLDATFTQEGPSTRGTVAPPAGQTLRIIFQQFEESTGRAKRTTGGSPPKGTPLGQMLTLQATQAGRDLPVKINYDKAIWSGLSWAVGEIDCAAIPVTPIEITGSTTETGKLKLTCDLYAVDYR